MRSTLNSIMADRRDKQKTQQKKDFLKQKLVYEWKNIFRQCMTNETYPKGQGWIKISDFKSALSDNNVLISKPEFDLLCQLHQTDGASKDTINYKTVSMSLGLHSSKIDQIQANPLLMKSIQPLKQQGREDQASSLSRQYQMNQMRKTLPSFKTTYY